MTPKLYKLHSGFAKYNKLLIYFVAVPLFETQKAVYLYGHGTTETAKMGLCCNCGRALTHPVSVELGIGPECGQHFHDWDMIGGYTQENIERLKGAMVNIKFDSWVPKSQIDSTFDTEETVIVPEDHPMLKRKEPDILAVFDEKLENKVEMPKEIKSTKILRYCEVWDSKGSNQENLIKVVFPYDMEDISRIKTITDRKYKPEQRCWTVPTKITNLQQLKDWGFTLAPELASIYEQSKPENAVVVDNLKPMLIPGLLGKLFPYQGVAVTFFDLQNGRALCADDMGIGKTIESIGWLQLHPELRPAIIIVPAIVKENWFREINKWMPIPKCEVLTGRTPYNTWGEILIINYDIVAAWLPVLLTKGFKVLVMDEIQKIKESTSKRTKAVKKLAKGISKVIGLSGTPIENRPVELYNGLSIINSFAIPNFKEYTRKFCDAKHNGFGWDYKGSTNTDELHKLLVNSFMIRRRKQDIFKDLPDKIRSFVPIELDNKKEYISAEHDFISYVKSTKGMAAAERASNAVVLSEIEGLKQLAVKGKLNQCIDWIKDFLETDNKLVVFAVHKFVIDALMEAFPEISVKIDGSISSSKREQAVQSFQNDPKITLFIGNIQAAGVGITLTAAYSLAFIELPWTPKSLDQAEDRIYGRVNNLHGANIYFLLAADTIEEKIARLLDSKRKVIDAVMDGKQTDKTSLLSELMKEYL